MRKQHQNVQMIRMGFRLNSDFFVCSSDPRIEVEAKTEALVKYLHQTPMYQEGSATQSPPYGQVLFELNISSLTTTPKTSGE